MSLALLVFPCGVLHMILNKARRGDRDAKVHLLCEIMIK
jgi:hypothetical protein